MPQPEEPSPWVVRFAPLVPAGGTVLDLACGGGRHARLFLARGHPVIALDRDPGQLAELARAPGMEVVRADLEDGSPWPLAGRRFAAVVVTNYLFRPLFPIIIEALGPEGVLIYETFAQGQEALGRPANPEFLLAPGELLQVVAKRLRSSPTSTAASRRRARRPSSACAPPPIRHHGLCPSSRAA